MSSARGRIRSDVFPGLLTSAEFDKLAREYRRATGLALCAADVDGRVVRASSGTRGCATREECRPTRAQAIAESHRWGEPCVLCCACGRLTWGVPVMVNQRLCGGLFVSGVALNRPQKAGELDQRVLSATRVLAELAATHNLSNAAHLAERRSVARRESERAEALHALKDRLHDDIRSTYLHEEPALLAAIRRGERSEARRILNRVLTAMYSLGASHTKLLKSLALELVVMMNRAAVQAGADPEKVLGLNYQSLTELAAVADQEALAPWLCDMLELLIDAIETHTRRPNSVLLAQAVEYIEKNLGGPVSRDDAARAAGLSPSHFSHLMRAKTGWTFKELLTRLRVDRACHLLGHSDLDLVEIGLQCGFEEQSYFTRVFRARVGQTPGEYRRGRRGDAQKS